MRTCSTSSGETPARSSAALIAKPPSSAALNPASKKVVAGYIEPSLANAQPDDKFQFERHGYFVADRVDHAPGKPVLNRIATLKDSWAK